MFSTMGRLLAEGLDTKIIGDRMQTWYDQLRANVAAGDVATHNPALFKVESWPTGALQGVGYTEAPRGALGHWVKFAKEETFDAQGFPTTVGKILNYQCVVPTTWNAAPRDHLGQPSPYEAALADGKHTLAVPDQPLEILRTIHSFNPCMACAVHLVDPEGKETLRVTVKG
jgi:hydrogenase large subunit